MYATGDGVMIRFWRVLPPPPQKKAHTEFIYPFVRMHLQWRACLLLNDYTKAFISEFTFELPCTCTIWNVTDLRNALYNYWNIVNSYKSAQAYNNIEVQ